MCGILGMVSKDSFSVRELVSRLQRLEYRGYDSAGCATAEGFLRRKVGSISGFLASLPEDAAPDATTCAAIAHTRWATHGGIAEQNAHPHCAGDVCIVHNGIIENFLELKEELELKGAIFRSETDSEVIAHFLQQYAAEPDLHKGMQDLMERLHGTYAIIALRKGDPRLWVAKKDSPVVLGIVGSGGSASADGYSSYIVSSDIFAFSDLTRKAVFLEDFQYLMIDAKSARLYDRKGKQLPVKPKEFHWESHNGGKMHYEHHMIKEIYEVPDVARNLEESLAGPQAASLSRMISLLRESSRIILLGSGTSYHAALLGRHLLTAAGLDAYAYASTDFDASMARSHDAIIAISQSGETMDLLVTLKAIAARPDRGDIRIMGLINVPHSSIERMADCCIRVEAGQEVCVAATKSFANQIVALLTLAKAFGFKTTYARLPLAEVIEQAEPVAQEIAPWLASKQSMYIIGAGACYPAAMEMALKIKEVSYIHAEGMLAGELKHGTLALIEKDVPVIAIIPDAKSHTVSSVKEVEARGASSVLVAGADKAELGLKGKALFRVPAGSDAEVSLFAAICGQLIAYYTAKHLDRPIDKPRNLAKSVTVL